MPFATIALVALAICWIIYLTCVQLLSGPRRDSSSDLNVPPRAVNGNGALPVLGHTLLFHKLGGDMAALFHPEGRAWKWFPWSRQLGETYSVFLWGQWRVMVIGPEKVRKVMGEAEVAEGWPYGTPPVALLGKSCPALLDGEEAECLRRMIYTPLSYASVVKHAPQFAEIAQKCIDDIVAGHFNKHHDTHDAERPRKRPQDLPFSESQSSDGGENSKAHKVKHEALRAYTFDLIDGPVLNMDRYSAGSTYSSRTSVRLKNISGGRVDEANRTVRFEDDNSVDDDDDDEPTPELIMLWIDRLKDGLCDIKFTFGPTWMQLWRLNPYGRALNARQHLEAIIQDHVEQREKLVPVHHEKGRMTRDPFTSPLPLLKMTENYFFRNHHHVMGKNRSKSNIQQTSTRARTQSESDLPDQHLEDSSRLSSGALLSPVVLRDRAQSEPDLVAEMDSSRSLGPKPITRKKTPSILDQILREADFEGRGITKAATTEISILLWMMLDAGQGWTAMALHLLAKHDDAQMTVQAEIDRLERTYGTDRLFTSFVLGKMDKLNNLIYESMRLCPQFLGGLKIINQTVEVGNVQIPKNSNVIFCNPHDDETFTIDYIPAKRPEEMGIFYPSLELHGFLPLEGLEIPLMVLQTKIFLIVLLQNFSPSISKRTTFIKRIQKAINKSISRHIHASMMSTASVGASPAGGAGVLGSSPDDTQLDLELGSNSGSSSDGSPPSSPVKATTRATTTTTKSSKEVGAATATGEHQRDNSKEDDRMFTRVPFPEARRPINIRVRPDKELYANHHHHHNTTLPKMTR